LKKTFWTEISCKVPVEIVDEFSDFLTELTGIGVSIENCFLNTFDIETVESPRDMTVKSYLLPGAGSEEIITKIREYFDAYQEKTGFIFELPTVSLIAEEDWANNWKSNFKPVQIGNRLVVKPTWESYTTSEDILILELDPGMAFGTGTHATTCLCIEALEESVATDNDTVLDVGCGSGILSIAALLFGVRHAVAIDIDPISVESARANARLNRVYKKMEISLTPIDAISETFPIVVANILAEDLVKMSQLLVNRVKSNGILILSGILKEREAYVIEGFSSFPIVLISSTASDEWCCLKYRKVG